jgi:hypothetical protein
MQIVSVESSGRHSVTILVSTTLRLLVAPSKVNVTKRQTGV